MADYDINAVTRRVVYTGSAGTGPYAFSFEILAATDLAVYKNATLLTLTTDYSVTINANGTGSVTLVSAAISADRITILGKRAIARTTDFVTAGDFLASALNEQLDSQIIMLQQLAEENKRTMKAPAFDPSAVEDGGTLDLTLPVAASRAGKLLAFDSNGNPVVGDDIGNYRGNWAAGQAYRVRDIVMDASNGNLYRCKTNHTSAGVVPISTNAGVGNWDILIDVATVTSTASAAAVAAKNAAEAAYDSFDDRYLGTKSSNPTLDNDGNALLTGALYYNTTASEMRVYSGSAWVPAYVPSTNYVAKAGDTMSGALVVSQTGSIFPGSFRNSGTTSSDHAIVYLGTNTTGATASISGIYFGDGDASTQGQIRYTHSTDAFTFFTNGAVRATLGSGGLLTLSSGSGLSIASTGVTSPATADGNVFSGTYTPSQVSTNTNVTSITFGVCQYMRVGNVVTVSGQVAVTATTASTATLVRFSLPIASTFTSTRHLGGGGGAITTTYSQGGVAMLADTTNYCVDMRFTPAANTATTWTFTFTYQVL